MHPSSLQNAPIIPAKCTDVDNTSNILNKDNLDTKSKESEVFNFVEENKEREMSATSTDVINQYLDSSNSSNESCNLMKFHPVSQRVADEINKRAGRSFSRRFINMRIEKLNESYKGTNKAVFKNEYGFIEYMRKLFNAEKIQEFVANRLDFEFRKRTVKVATNSESKATDVKYTDIDQSTTLGKIQASSFAWYGDGVYKSWFLKPTILSLSETSKEIVIECKSGFIAGYIKQHYYKALTESCNVVDFRWWKVDETMLIIPMKEADIVVANDLRDSITLESALKLEKKCEDIVVDSSLVFSKSVTAHNNEELITKTVEIEDIETNDNDIVNKSITVKSKTDFNIPTLMLNFVKRINYDSGKAVCLKNELVVKYQNQTQDEILTEIEVELSEKYAKQDSDTIFDEERNVRFARLKKSDRLS